jgi:hypothetical protein
MGLGIDLILAHCPIEAQPRSHCREQQAPARMQCRKLFLREELACERSDCIRLAGWRISGWTT